MPITKQQSTKRILLSDFFDTEEIASEWRKADSGTKEAIKAAVGEFIVNQINRHLDRGETPVEGGNYKRTLAKKPGQRGLPRISRLLESGDMRSQITFNEGKGTALDVGIFTTAPKEDRLKASGHNRGDSATGIQREFIPDGSEAFKPSINKGIRSIIRDALQGSEDASDT